MGRERRTTTHGAFPTRSTRISRLTAALFAVYRKPIHLLPRRYYAACETEGF